MAYDAKASIKLPTGLPYYTGDVWDGKTPGKVPDKVCSSAGDTSSTDTGSTDTATGSTPGFGGFVVAAAGVVAAIVARL